MGLMKIRGFQKGRLVFEEMHDTETVQIKELVEQHILRISKKLNMVEFEFVDHPNPDRRFFRFGAYSSSATVGPVEIELTSLPKVRRSKAKVH